jgi:hypothetical protein
MTYDAQKKTLDRALLSQGLTPTTPNVGDLQTAMSKYEQDCREHDNEVESAVTDLAPELGYTSEEAQDFTRIYRGKSTRDTTDMMRRLRLEMPALFHD